MPTLYRIFGFLLLAAANVRGWLGGIAPHLIRSRFRLIGRYVLLSNTIGQAILFRPAGILQRMSPGWYCGGCLGIAAKVRIQRRR